MVTIRPATSEDLAIIADLCAAHAAYEKAVFNPSGFAERMGQGLTGPAPRVSILLAETADAPAGYAALTREYSTWNAADYLHLDCLFVVEPVRGLGIGRLLVNAVLKTAETQNIGQIQWQTPDWNIDAIRFYRSLGASGSGKIRFVLDVMR